MKKANQSKVINRIRDIANSHISGFQKLILESRLFNVTLDIFVYSLLIISIIYGLINAFAVSSYAGELQCDKSLMQNYIQSEYGLNPDDWDCTQEAKHKYSIVIEYPIRRICHIREDIFYSHGENNTKSTSVCEDDIATSIGTDGIEHIIGDVLEYGYQTHNTTIEKQAKKEVLGHLSQEDYKLQMEIIDELGIAYNTNTTTYEWVIENVEIPSYKTHDVEAFLSGYTTIYSTRQLEMSDVDINIIDGKVKVTGILNDDTAGWNVIYDKYKVVINGFLGLCVLSCILVFIVSSIKLGATAGNPGERKKVMTAMLLSGIGTAALGAVILFFSFFFNLI